jgi:hypothetical protein
MGLAMGGAVNPLTPKNTIYVASAAKRFDQYDKDDNGLLEGDEIPKRTSENQTVSSDGLDFLDFLSREVAPALKGQINTTRNIDTEFAELIKSYRSQGINIVPLLILIKLKYKDSSNEQITKFINDFAKTATATKNPKKAMETLISAFDHIQNFDISLTKAQDLFLSKASKQTLDAFVSGMTSSIKGAFTIPGKDVREDELYTILSRTNTSDEYAALNIFFDISDISNLGQYAPRIHQLSEALSNNPATATSKTILYTFLAIKSIPADIITNLTKNLSQEKCNILLTSLSKKDIFNEGDIFKQCRDFCANYLFRDGTKPSLEEVLGYLFDNAVKFGISLQDGMTFLNEQTKLYKDDTVTWFGGTEAEAKIAPSFKDLTYWGSNGIVAVTYYQNQWALFHPDASSSERTESRSVGYSAEYYLKDAALKEDFQKFSERLKGIQEKYSFSMYDKDDQHTRRIVEDLEHMLVFRIQSSDGFYGLDESMISAIMNTTMKILLTCSDELLMKYNDTAHLDYLINDFLAKNDSKSLPDYLLSKYIQNSKESSLTKTSKAIISSMASDMATPSFLDSTRIHLDESLTELQSLTDLVDVAEKELYRLYKSGASHDKILAACKKLEEACQDLEEKIRALSKEAPNGEVANALTKGTKTAAASVENGIKTIESIEQTTAQEDLREQLKRAKEALQLQQHRREQMVFDYIHNNHLENSLTKENRNYYDEYILPNALFRIALTKSTQKNQVEVTKTINEIIESIPQSSMITVFNYFSDNLKAIETLRKKSSSEENATLIKTNQNEILHQEEQDIQNRKESNQKFLKQIMITWVNLANKTGLPPELIQSRKAALYSAGLDQNADVAAIKKVLKST